MTLLLEIAVTALLVAGAGFALVGSWGLAKFTDFYRRLHGPSKATTLGVGCVLVASGLWFTFHGAPSWHELLITLFLFLTAPVSAHLLVQAALKLDPASRPALPGSPARPPLPATPGPTPAPRQASGEGP